MVQAVYLTSKILTAGVALLIRDCRRIKKQKTSSQATINKAQ